VRKILLLLLLECVVVVVVDDGIWEGKEVESTKLGTLIFLRVFINAFMAGYAFFVFFFYGMVLVFSNRHVCTIIVFFLFI